MSEKYIKRTKKGKGKAKKTRVKEIKEVFNQIKPEIQIALSLMVIESLKKEDDKSNGLWNV